MVSTDEGGRTSLIDATSKTSGTAVCANHTIRANNMCVIEDIMSTDDITCNDCVSYHAWHDTFRSPPCRSTVFQIRGKQVPKASSL
jgi:hypothetical protein